MNPGDTKVLLYAFVVALIITLFYKMYMDSEGLQRIPVRRSTEGYSASMISREFRDGQVGRDVSYGLGGDLGGVRNRTFKSSHPQVKYGYNKGPLVGGIPTQTPLI